MLLLPKCGFHNEYQSYVIYSAIGTLDMICLGSRSKFTNINRRRCYLSCILQVSRTDAKTRISIPERRVPIEVKKVKESLPRTAIDSIHYFVITYVTKQIKKKMSSMDNLHVGCSGLFSLLLIFGIFVFLMYDTQTGIFLLGVSLLGFLILTPSAYIPWADRGYIYAPSAPMMAPISQLEIPKLGEVIKSA